MKNKIPVCGRCGIRLSEPFDKMPICADGEEYTCENTCNTYNTEDICDECENHILTCTDC